MKNFYGNYLGLCINNNDPEKRGRVQIFIPHIMPALYQDLLNENEDLKIVCVGDNIPDSLPGAVVEKLMKVLPWAEVASPILGMSSPGNLITQGLNAVAGAVSSFFNQSPTINGPITAPGGGTINGASSGGVGGNWAGSVDKLSQILPVGSWNPSSQKRTIENTASGNMSDHFIGNDKAYGIDLGLNSSFGGDITKTTQTALQIVNNVQAQLGRPAFTSWNQVTDSRNGRRGSYYEVTPDGYRVQVLWLSDKDHEDHIHIGVENTGRATTPSNFPQPSNNNGYTTTANAGAASTLNPHQAQNPSFNGSAGNATFAQPIVMSLDGSGPAPRTTSATQFAFNNDGNTQGDQGLSSTYQNKTASGIPNDSEILGYTIPLDASLKQIARDSSGNSVANLKQPAIITFRTSSGQEYRVLAVGNDTGGRQVGGNPLVRDWGEFGTNTFRALNKQGLNVQLGRNSISLPPGTTAIYEFLNGSIDTVQQYRELQNELVQTGRLDPSQVSTPIDNGAANVSDRSDISSMVMNTDKNGPTAVLNINNMAKGVFTYPAAGALLWVFFREGDPLFPVYFAASYGEREWQSAFRQGSDAPMYKPAPTPENPTISTGTEINWGPGGLRIEDTTDPRDYRNNQKSLMLYGHDGSNMFFNDGYHQIFSKFDRRDQVDGDRFHSTLGIKEELVQSDSNSIVMGDQVIKVGNITPETIQAAQNIQNSINKIMKPLSVNNPPIPSRKNSFVGKSKYFTKALKDAKNKFKISQGPFTIPVQEFITNLVRATTSQTNDGSAVSNPSLQETSQQTLNRINSSTTTEINSQPIEPPTSPRITE